MKKTLILVIGLFALIFLTSTQTKAQTFEFNSNQTLTVSSPGFFPFSTTSNNQFKQDFPGNPNVDVIFNNFLGSPCEIAPAADFGEIGAPILISGNGQFVLDFSMAGPNAGTFGLSLVPQNGVCIFDLLVMPHAVTTTTSSTSSSSGEVIGGGGIFNPNSLTIVSSTISGNLVDQLSNDQNNPQCGTSPSGINGAIFANDSTFINSIYNELLGRNGNDTLFPLPNKTVRNLNSKSDMNYFTLEATGTSKPAMGVYNQKLSNTTDMLQIYVTGIFPSVTEDSSIMIGANRSLSSDFDVTVLNQVDPALAAVQHAIVSATMPWQLSPGNGFFITQGGGCVGPFCTIVESGMVVIVPGGACTPDKLSKRRAGYPTVNPSKFFDPFPASAKTIQIPTSSIVDPKHPLVSKVVQDSAYLIFQPVPPGAMLIQQLKLGIEEKK